jgi:hypothetical protein
MFYSKSTGGFYTAEIHGDNIPSDAVSITVDEWKALLKGQSEGKVISADSNGKPILTEPPPVKPAPPMTTTQKLEALGLTVDELKALIAG